MVMKQEEVQRFKLSREQFNALSVLTNPDHKHISRLIYGGQAGGGKSFLICLWLHSMAKTYEGTRYYMSRERLKDIKESVLLTFWDVLKLCNDKVHYNASTSVITYANRSQIYLVESFHYPSDPNFDSLGSREYTAGAIEEGITVTKRAADILLSRTRYKHDVFGLYPKQLITCNPGDGWIKDEVVIPQIDGTKKKHNDLFIRATLGSNPNKVFRESYEKTLQENLTEFDRARLLHGDWNAKPKFGVEYLKEFSADLHAGETSYNPQLPLHISFDENVNPYITCLVWQIQKVGHLTNIVQLAEICQKPPVNTRKHVCNTLLAQYSDHISGMFIYGDASSYKNETGKEYGENFFTDIMTHLRKFNPTLRVPLKNPPVVSKAGFINKVCESNYQNLRLIIDRNCKLSISDYAYTVEDSDGGILKKRVTDPNTGISYEKNGHHVDSMTYFICEAFRGEFEYYMGGDYEHAYDTGIDRKYTFRR